MIREAIDRILGLAPPNQITVGDKLYVDKDIHIVKPPVPSEIDVSTLQGLVDLLEGEIEDVKADDDLLVHIQSPFLVSLIGRKSDSYGRRQIYAEAHYPEKSCPTFTFGNWFHVENFLIAVQQGFQRVKIQGDDGTFAKDLDYVLEQSSRITADSTVTNVDDGISQRVNVAAGVVLKESAALRARVTLAPYRTFAEIDQVPATFIFRAKQENGVVKLALFEGDGGRWRLDAVAAIKAWLGAKITGSPIIS
jgi:hypothetical protein